MGLFKMGKVFFFFFPGPLPLPKRGKCLFYGPLPWVYTNSFFLLAPLEMTTEQEAPPPSNLRRSRSSLQTGGLVSIRCSAGHLTTKCDQCLGFCGEIFFVLVWGGGESEDFFAVDRLCLFDFFYLFLVLFGRFAFGLGFGGAMISGIRVLSSVRTSGFVGFYTAFGFGFCFSAINADPLLSCLKEKPTANQTVL